MTAGEIIKKLRIEKGYTQTELAIMLGLKLSTMQKYESGAILNLKVETIRELCHIFDVPATVFIFPEYVEFPQNENISTIFNADDIRECTTAFVNLNETGRKKSIEYMNDLISSENYKNKLSNCKLNI
jgi:repressor LexA